MPDRILAADLGHKFRTTADQDDIVGEQTYCKLAETLLSPCTTLLLQCPHSRWVQGTLPPAWAGLSSMRVLVVANNNLTGKAQPKFRSRSINH